ncbi:MAG: hypothetical protein M5R42_13605 [Rhodocyclaceae bacterium]|nr:hypothetical protein [Rhodocyclaceae bacterium]
MIFSAATTHSLGEAARAGKAHDAIACLQALHACADFLIRPATSAPGENGSGGLTW